MTGFEMPISLFLLFNLIVALFAAARRRTAADRMLVAMLFGSTGVAILVLLAHTDGKQEIIAVALVLALLAAITGLAFARRAWHKMEFPDD